MAKKPTIKAQKDALYREFRKCYDEYFGDKQTDFNFRYSYSLESCKADLEKLKQGIESDKYKRQYLAQTAGLEFDEVQNEQFALVTLKHFFTDSRIVHFPFEEVQNPYFTRARPMKIYHLYDVIKIAQSEQFEPRLKKIDYSNIEEQHHDKLRSLYSYFEAYVAYQEQGQ